MSPYDMEHGVPPDLSHLRPFGSTAYVHVPHDGREKGRSEKLDAAAEVGILVGYSTTSASVKNGIVFW